MTKCEVVGCEAPVVSGLKQLAFAGHSLAPKATIDAGFRFYWCENHEQEVKELAADKLTKPLTKKELRTKLK